MPSPRVTFTISRRKITGKEPWTLVKMPTEDFEDIKETVRMLRGNAPDCEYRVTRKETVETVIEVE